MAKPTGIRIAIEDAPEREVRERIDAGLDDDNLSRAGPYGARDVWVLARDTDDEVCGGLKGSMSYRWLFIDWLWVSPQRRGEGLGSALLEKAEAGARDRGCIGAYVDTYSFQAPDFYRAHGYEEFGRLEDMPPGHACIWLKKRW